MATIAEQVLEWLWDVADESRGDGAGWNVNDGTLPPGMSLRKTQAALQRLKRAGLVTVHEWHSNQDVRREWLWFPVDTSDPNRET